MYARVHVDGHRIHADANTGGRYSDDQRQERKDRALSGMRDGELWAARRRHIREAQTASIGHEDLALEAREAWLLSMAAVTTQRGLRGGG